MKLSINKNTLESAVILCNAYVEKKRLKHHYFSSFFFMLMKINFLLELVIMK